MQITKDIAYIGVDDYRNRLFEGLFPTPNGMAYNSYVLFDEKIAVFDTVDAAFEDEWFNNLKTVLNGREPNYLIVQHMEPDHSANVLAFAKTYPNATIVGTDKAFRMLKNYFGTEFEDRRRIVGENDKLCLGAHTLTFYTAPMVHWPEVMVSYDDKDGVLFSADAFGKFGASTAKEDWACEARRYYFGIVGKYGVQVQTLLKKLQGLDIKTICSLHGPVLSGDLRPYLRLYDLWSKYEVETDGVCIVYTSVYGNTKRAAELLATELKALGCEEIELIDLGNADLYEGVEGAFRYRATVLATTTYNGGVFPFMRNFIQALTERNFQNRTVAFIENGSWAPVATQVMKKMLEGCKNINYAQTDVTVLSALNEASKAQMKALAQEIYR